MRRLWILPVLFLTLFVSAGCATKVGQAITAATSTFTNPVGPVDIYRVKNVYAASLQLAVDWRDYCYSKPYAVLMAEPAAKLVCQSRRSVVRRIQATQPKAASAVRDAERFVLQNPTLNAASVISAAWDAVNNFKNAVPAGAN